MSYLVTSYDGNFVIPPLTIDTSNTALSLPGMNYSGWGQAFANDLTHLMENFAVGEPSVKRTGMLWYDVGVRALKVWDTGLDTWTELGTFSNTTGSLETPVTIAVSGAATGSVSFDGSAGVTIPLTLALSGVVGGSYTFANITVNNNGLITSASSGTLVTSFTGPGESKRTGDVTLTSGDVVAALGFTPLSGLSNSGVSAGSYTMSDLTIDIYGRITAASSHSLTSNQVITALGFTPISGLTNSGVTAGSYTTANLTVDQYGRITAATSGIPNGAVANINMANMANATVKGNISGSSAAPSDISLSALYSALNIPFSQTFTGNAGVINSTTMSVAHPFSGIPFGFDAYAQCVTSDSGFSVGQQVKLPATTYTGGGGGVASFAAVYADSSNIYFTCNNISFISLKGNTQYLTPSCWVIIFKAWS